MITVCEAEEQLYPRELINGCSEDAMAVTRVLLHEDQRHAEMRRRHVGNSRLLSSQPHYRFLAPERTVGIVNAPFSGGQPRKGTELGPASILQTGLIDQIKGLDWSIHEHGSVPLEDIGAPDASGKKVKGCWSPRLVGSASRLIHEAVLLQACERRFSLTLGGDHSVAMATISATSVAYGKELGVIWVDAHADLNTPAVSLSGNMHGMPVAFLLGLPGTEGVPGFEWFYDKGCCTMSGSAAKATDAQNQQPFGFIRAENIVYVGLRDVDEAEKKIMRKYNILAFSMYDVDLLGIGAVMERALAYLGPDRPIHLSFDIDGTDPLVAPSTGTPVRGGLSFREGRTICDAMARSGQLVALDLVEVNPCLNTPSHEDEAARRKAGYVEKTYVDPSEDALKMREAQQTVDAARGLAMAALGMTLL